MSEPATLDTPVTPLESSQPTTPPVTIVSPLTGQKPASTRQIPDSPPSDQIDHQDKPGDKILSLDDLDSAFDLEGDKPPVTTKPKDAKQQDTSKDKSSDKPPVETKAKEEPKKEDEGFDLGIDEPKVEDNKGKKSRDYSGLKQEHVDILKHVPNYMYEKARETLLELDKTKAKLDEVTKNYEEIKSGKLPDNYYEHEKAYLLHPEFEEVSRTSDLLDFEENHWKNQLRLIKQGKNWFDLKGYKKDTGEPVYEEHKSLGEGKIDIDGDLELTDRLATIRARKLEISKKLQDITTNFKSRHEQTTKTLEGIETKYFSKMKDMSKLPKEAQDYYNGVVEWFKQNAPTLNIKIAEMFAKSALSNVYKTQELEKRDKIIKQLSEKHGDTREAGPTSKDLSGGGKPNLEKEYDTKNLEKDWS